MSSVILEVKRILETQGCKSELVDIAVKEYINGGNKLADENIRLKLENEALDVELIDLKHETKSFIDTMETTLERIIAVDLNDSNSIENFKKIQHEASKKVNIIKLLKKLI